MKTIQKQFDQIDRRTVVRTIAVASGVIGTFGIVASAIVLCSVAIVVGVEVLSATGFFAELTPGEMRAFGLFFEIPLFVSFGWVSARIVNYCTEYTISPRRWAIRFTGVVTALGFAHVYLIGAGVV